MSITSTALVAKIRNRSTSSAARTRRDLSRALATAPTMATREELYVLQNR